MLEEKSRITELAQKIEDIRNRALQGNKPMGEGTVILARVMPILNILGWDPEDPNAVVREYSVKGYKDKRADIALGENMEELDGRVHVFVEAKASEESLNEKYVSQLEDYCLKQRVPLGVLTNGTQWNFYLYPQGTCEPFLAEEIHIKEQDKNDCASKFVRILSRDQVIGKRHLQFLNEATLPRFAKQVWDDLIRNPEKIMKIVQKLLGEKRGQKVSKEESKQLEKWLKDKMHSAISEEKSEVPTNPNTTEPEVKPNLAISLADTPHFRVLGSSGMLIVIRFKKTLEIVSMPKKTLGSERSLISLAPLEWWLEKTEGKDLQDKSVRMSFHSAIIEAAHNAGFFNMSMPVLGRGGAKVEGIGYIYNLGDRLITEGKSGNLEIERRLDLNKVKDIGIFVPGQPLRLMDDENAPQYGKDFAHAVMAYRWASERDGKAFLGWLVASLIGGALRHKPMVWLQAPTSSGKTWILEHVVSKIMGDCLYELADVTEAALIRLIGHDSVPVYIDGFEPTGGTGSKQKFNAVLKLLRLARDGKGLSTGKSVPNHQIRPRFSALLASINKPNLSSSDASRFYMLGLSRTEVDDWGKVRDGIADATTEEKMLALRSYIIRNTPRIAKMAEHMEHEISAETTQQAQIVAALSAGYSFLTGRRTILEVHSLLEEDQHDEYTILKTLLSALVLTDRGEKVSIIDCLTRSFFGKYNSSRGLWELTSYGKSLGSLASRYGFRLLKHNDEGKEMERPSLLCAINHPPMDYLLSRTEYSSINLYNYLKRLPGAELPRNETGRRKRHYIAGSAKSAVALPPKALEICGFFPDNRPMREDVMDVGE